jgi:2-polyprenyl-6-methoxyphenol hydroxylase-like FAD-dependent oxidoreductase
LRSNIIHLELLLTTSTRLDHVVKNLHSNDAIRTLLCFLPRLTSEQVGASLSGLMCANSLISQGLDVTILEQKTKDDMRSTTGISLGRPVRYLFRKYVPYGNLEKKAVPHNKSVNFSREGEIQDNPLLKSSEEVITSSWSNVRSLLEANLPGQTYGHGANISLKYGCKVTGMEEEKGEMKLTYFDCGEQKADLFDLVIGADGARSSVRNMVLPDLKSEYSGHVAWRGEVLKQGCPSQLECVQQGALGFIRMPRSKSYILL